jgi:multimeric flavodoxin WrbA
MTTKERRRSRRESVLVINGATREDGNTDRLLQHFVRGVREAGGRAVKVKLRNRNIGQCVGCGTCRDEGRCGYDDGMTVLRRRLEKSEVLVFASPVYWCEITGLLKTFIDRLYFYHHPKNAPLVEGKKAVVVLTLGESENVGYETEVAMEFFRRLFKSLKITWLETLFFPALKEKDDLVWKAGYSQIAFEAGRKLGEAANRGTRAKKTASPRPN